MTDSTFRYRLDSRDCIVCVDQTWTRFAEENEAGELADGAIGAPIWQFMTGEARHLYEMLFASVRADGRVIAVPFRCDSPTTRRYMKLTVSPVADQGLAIVGRLLKCEERPFVGLLDDTRPADTTEFVTICSWCKHVRLADGSWCEVESAVQALRLFEKELLPSLTHGICPSCEEKMRAAIR